MRLLRVMESEKPEKKLKAIFETESGRTKTIHFGQRGADDFTITGDKAQRERYINRHSANENFQKADTGGALSRWVLWGNSKSRAKNIADFKRRFNL